MSTEQEQVVLITGAAGNLGATTAAAFRRGGARTVLVDRSLDKLRRAHPGASDAADQLLIGDVDLGDAASAQEIVARAVARFGAVDAVVNTVGAFRAGKRVHDEDLATWDLLFTVNVRTALVSCRAALPGMLARGRGRIVNVASRDALLGEDGTGAYAASKAALLRMTESIASEVRGHGVTANCVLPGTIDTPQNSAGLAAAAHATLVPLAAVADVIVFLASDAARAVSGAAIPVYGG
jgi:NAD(P)-dependent dehydrogenase (short-subunit alcohol dehydrogenase family)